MEHRQAGRQSYGEANPEGKECPVCHTALSEPEHEHAMLEMQRLMGEALKSAPNVKYQRIMKSMKYPEGTELVSLKEGYERLSSGAAGQIESLLDSGSDRLKSAYGSASAAAMREYGAARYLLTQRVPKLLSRLASWFEKWLFTVFKKMADALAAVTG